MQKQTGAAKSATAHSFQDFKDGAEWSREVMEWRKMADDIDRAPHLSSMFGLTDTAAQGCRERARECEQRVIRCAIRSEIALRTFDAAQQQAATQGASA